MANHESPRATRYVAAHAAPAGDVGLAVGPAVVGVVATEVLGASTAGTLAPTGRHSDIPGNNGVEVLASLARTREFIEIFAFDATRNHESPRATVYELAHVGPPATEASTDVGGTAAGTVTASAADTARARRYIRRRAASAGRSICRARSIMTPESSAARRCRLR